MLVFAAGMDEHSKISRNAAVGVHGYLLVYAANSRASFERVQAIDDMLVDIHGGSLHVPRVVVATCMDLVDQRQARQKFEVSDTLVLRLQTCFPKH